MEVVLFVGLIAAIVAVPLAAAFAIVRHRPQWRDPVVLASQTVLFGALAFASYSFLRHLGTPSESAMQWVPLAGLVILAIAFILWWTGRGVTLSVVSGIAAAVCVFSLFSWVGWAAIGWVLVLLVAALLSTVLGRPGRSRRAGL